MKKFLLNYILVFSLVFGSLSVPRKADAFIGGDGSIDKLATYAYLLSIGIVSAKKMITCTAIQPKPGKSAYSFWIFHPATIAYVLEELYFTTKDEEDVDQVLQDGLEAAIGDHGQIQAYRKAAEISEKNAENSEMKSTIRYAIGGIMGVAAGVAAVEWYFYNAIYKPQDGFLSASCIDAEAFNKAAIAAASNPVTAGSAPALESKSLSAEAAAAKFATIKLEEYNSYKVICTDDPKTMAHFATGEKLHLATVASPCVGGLKLEESVASTLKDAEEQAEYSVSSIVFEQIVIGAFPLLIQMMMGSSGGDGPGLIGGILAVVMLVRGWSSGYPEEYLPITRTIAYGFFAAQTLLSAYQEGEDAKEFKDRAAYYNEMADKLEAKKNQEMAQGTPGGTPVTGTGGGPTTSSFSGGSVPSGIPTNTTTSVNSNNNTCFTLGSDGQTPTPDKGCACKATNSCGEFAAPPANVTAFANSLPGGSAISQAGQDIRDLANARMRGDSEGALAAAGKINKNAAAYKKFGKDVKANIDKFFKDNGKTPPDFDRLRADFGKKLNDAMISKIKSSGSLTAGQKSSLTDAFSKDKAKLAKFDYNQFRNSNTGKKKGVKYSASKFKVPGFSFGSSMKKPKAKIEVNTGDIALNNAMKKAYKVKDINKNKGGNIFKILSHRYLKSGTARLELVKKNGDSKTQ